MKLSQKFKRIALGHVTAARGSFFQIFFFMCVCVCGNFFSNLVKSMWNGSQWNYPELEIKKLWSAEIHSLSDL